MSRGSDWLRLPVVAASSEHLVMGYLMRRNVLTYKAPPNNEGYDLIAIHPDPRYRPKKGQPAQLRIQVKSRYATDCNRAFPVRAESLDAFDFLVVAFLNIGRFYNGRDGTTGAQEPEFFTLPREFVRKHHRISTTNTWQKVHLRGLEAELAPFEGEAGFDLIAKSLGVSKPCRPERELPPRAV
jgi:hypothetical protein